MSSDLQDAVKLLDAMVPVLDPSEDFLTVAAAEEHMNIVAAQRELELDKIQNELRSLAHILDAARMSSTRPRGIPSAEEHVTLLNDLDAVKLSLAKGINDAEGKLASKEAELARLKEESTALKTSDPEQEHDLDSTPLKLAIYKGIGFQPVSDREGRVQKMLIRSQSEEVHCVPFDAGKSGNGYTEALWNLVSS